MFLIQLSLRSVRYFQPSKYRTAVFKEILLSYLKYIKERGYETTNIWVCPPRKGDDYIMYVVIAWLSDD